MIQVRPAILRRSLITLWISLVVCSCVFSVPGARAESTPESPSLDALSVGRLRCEMQEAPRNVDTTTPLLSWVLTSSGRGVRQIAYQVLAAVSPELLQPGKADLWDSGRVESPQSIHVPYAGRLLTSNQRVYWTVRVWDNQGRESAWAAPSRWEMALLDPADWKACWITAEADSATTVSSDSDTTATTASVPPAERGRPLFRKEFLVGKGLARAVVHVSGLGQHKLYVNGVAASENFLDPAWSAYAKTCFYSTYDISDKLRQGENAFGVMLASGWYDTRNDRRTNFNVAHRPLALCLQGHLWYEDGTEEVLVTDGTWNWRPGPYTHTSILGGVDYDARLLPDGWSSPGAQAEGWRPVRPFRPDHGSLTAAIAPPMRMFEEFAPRSIDEPEPGYFLYDFGQNASATPRLRVRGKAGDTLRLTYSEQRGGSTPAHNDGKGRADQSGIRSPNYIEYTLRGGEEESWCADLFYSGYQYMELTGAVPAGFPNPDGKPVVTELMLVHVRADAPQVGRFTCSDPMYERIDRMIDWSVRSNMGHVFTDCPQREKMGWLEQAHLMWPSIASRYDLSRLGAKVTLDMRDSQAPDGLIYTVAPSYAVFQGAFHYSPEYAAAAVLVPWYHYQSYGDLRILRDNYDCMRRLVDYMEKTSTELRPVGGLGDWYDYGHGQELGVSRFTPTELSAMCIFSECAQVVARSAAFLGKETEAEKYTALTERIRTAFNREYLKSYCEYQNAGSCQTANAMAVATGQVEPERRKAVVDRIVRDMKERGWLQTSGDIGFRYLLRALTTCDRHDVIFAMLGREELGSYRYLVNAGWTTLPESWNAFRHYSMNHCMLGHIVEWFSHDLGGIKPMAGGEGFRKFEICPVVDGPVTSASAALNSPYGEIRSAWQRENGRVALTVHVPVNTEALLTLPAAAGDSLREGEAPAREAAGVEVLPEEGTTRSYRLGSGKYSFTASLTPEQTGAAASGGADSLTGEPAAPRVIVPTAGANPHVVSGLEITASGNEVIVQPGVCRVGERRVEVRQPASFLIDAPGSVRVRNEEYLLSSDRPHVWASGTHLRGCMSSSTVLPGSLVPGSVEVRLADGTLLAPGRDYLIDEKWASLGRVAEGRIGTDTRTLISYSVAQMRIDLLEVDAEGRVSLKPGTRKKNSPALPEATSGSLRLAHVFMPYGGTQVEAWQILPIGLPFPAPGEEELAKRTALVSGTLRKLRSGSEVTVVAWGDSVTVGLDASTTEAAYANLFATRLRERFPGASIRLINAGISGSNTSGRLPNLQQDVLAHRPDLVTIEFVNDTSLPPEEVRQNWAKALEEIRKAGAEPIVITPHFTMAEWMGHSYPRGKETRPQVKVMREVAREKGVALADAAARWEHLESEGIPYIAYLDSGINHPDDRGHDLFVQELMTFFPR